MGSNPFTHDLIKVNDLRLLWKQVEVNRDDDDKRRFCGLRKGLGE